MMSETIKWNGRVVSKDEAAKLLAEFLRTSREVADEKAR